MPDWSSWEFWAKDSQGLYHLALIIAGAAGLVLLAIRTCAVNRSANAALKQSETAAERHKEQTDADRDRRITESFAKAIAQLGDDKLEIRLGGIYTLERIAQESERDYWPIMETLTAFVRERAKWPQAVANPFVELQGSAAVDETADESASKPEAETEPPSEIRPATDIQAVLTVLGRRDEAARQRDQAASRNLDLRKTDLRAADLRRAHLEDADFSEANLKGANFWNAHLERADLRDAHLKGTIFHKSYLEDAVFANAHLEDAVFLEANLEGAYFWNAHLERAFLVGMHLEGAVLTGADLKATKLMSANLKRAKLTTANLTAADLREANLTSANLEDATLAGANLTGADLGEASLTGANLTAAEWGAFLFKGADLKDAKIVNANLAEANLEGTQNLTQPQVNAANGDKKTRLPKGIDTPAHWLEDE